MKIKKLLLLGLSFVMVGGTLVATTFNQDAHIMDATVYSYNLTLNKENGYGALHNASYQVEPKVDLAYTKNGNEIKMAGKNIKAPDVLGDYAKDYIIDMRGNDGVYYNVTPLTHIRSITVNFKSTGTSTPSLYVGKGLMPNTNVRMNITSGTKYSFDATDPFFKIVSGDGEAYIKSISIEYLCDAYGGGGETIVNQPFSKLTTALNNSIPTKAVTRIGYYVPTNEVHLTFNSIFRINYDQGTKSHFSYNYQKLNEIVDENSAFVKTYTGEIYSKSSNVGQVIEGKIDWLTDIPGNVNLSNLNYRESYFSNIIHEEGNFSCLVNNESLIRFFGKRVNVYDAYLNVIYDPQTTLIKQINFTYVNDKNAEIEVTNTYSYSKEIIEIPENI